MSGNVLVGACGAAMMLNLSEYLIALHRNDFTVRVVLTATAASIVPARSLALCCDSVIDCSDRSAHFSPGHVDLARWADQILVLPATAHLLGVAAAGQAPNFLASVLLAHERPVTFFPSMNAAMLANPAVRRNIATLRADGHAVVDPVPRLTYEVASRTCAEAPTVPPPPQVAEYTRRALAARSRRSPDAGKDAFTSPTHAGKDAIPALNAGKASFPA